VLLERTVCRGAVNVGHVVVDVVGESVLELSNGSYDGVVGKLQGHAPNARNDVWLDERIAAAGQGRWLVGRAIGADRPEIHIKVTLIVNDGVA